MANLVLLRPLLITYIFSVKKKIVSMEERVMSIQRERRYQERGIWQMGESID